MKPCVLGVVLLTFAVHPCVAATEGDETPTRIVVVDDHAYAPFAFLDADGTPRGLTIDLWQLWSKRTGVPVEFRLMAWDAALAAVREGKADAIGGLFRTPEREAWFDFTEPLFEFPTSIFFHEQIQGIKDVNDLSGFTVGVIRGDSSEEFLRAYEPAVALRTYTGVDELVRAAVAGEIKVFMADTPVALHYLAKTPGGDAFRQSVRPVIDNRQYAAVRKGRTAALDLVRTGFSHISKEEIHHLLDLWGGLAVGRRIPWKQFGVALGVLVLLVCAVVVWNSLLRRSIRRATAHLADERKRLEYILGITKTGVDIIDPQFNLRYVDPAWQQVYGDPAGRKCFEYFMGRDRRCDGCGIPDALDTRKTTITEEVLVRENNRIVQVHTIPFQDASGEWLVAEFNVDITERKRAEEDQARLVAILENTSDLVSMATPDSRLTYLNSAGRQLLGWGEDESIEGRVIADLHSPEILRTIEQEALPAAVRVGLWKGETAVRHRDGREIPVSQVVLAHRRADGGIAFFSTIMRDISEVKRVAEERENLLAMFEASLAQSPSGILIADAPDVAIRWANPAALAIRGESDRPLTGIDLTQYATVWQMVRPDGAPYPPEQLPLSRAVLEGAIARNEEFIIRNALREDRWVLANAAPVRNRDGAIVSGIMVFHDITEHRRAQENLQEREETFRALAENSQDTIMRFDAQGRHLYVNPAVKIQTGLPPEAFIGRTHEQLGFPPDLCRIWEEAVRIVFETKKVHRIEFHLPNGNWIDWLLMPEFDEAGRVKAAITSARDITERKQAEEKNRRGMERLKAVIEILQHSAESLQDFLDQSLNQAIALSGSRIGYIYFYEEDRKQFILNTWSKDVMKECAVANPQTCYELDKTGIWGEAVRQRKPILINDFQARHPLKRGYPEGHVHLNRFLTVPVFHHEQIVAVVGVADKASDYDETDVLELTLLMDAVWKSVETIKSEGALRASEARYRELVENANSIILRMDHEGRITFFNEFAQQFFGYRAQDVIGRSVVGTIVPETDSAGNNLRAMIGDITKRPAYYAFNENENMRRDGTRMWISWTNRPLYNSAGGLSEVLCIGNDITARLQAEEERERLRAQLNQAQKMESVGRLAGGVAHDFNNMLGIILGHTELALEQLDPAQPLYSDIIEIRKAAEHSADLTRQLLALARRQTVTPKVLDLNETVEGMLKMMRRLIGENIDLLWRPGSTAGKVKMDPSQVDQILANLCVNARDAIVDTGKITIETGDAVFDEAYCAAHTGYTPGEYALLAVSDNGCGMEKGVLEKLFEPFFTTKEMGKGTGLGLATVYGIIKQNDGFVNVYSELGHGSTFKIYLPRYVGKDDPSREELSKGPGARGNETILVAEDEPGILRTVTTMLNRQGYSVLAAATPGEAIRLAREYAGEIHLLMTDVVMPEMNGRDLAQHLLTLYPHLKRLFMSGYTADVIALHSVLDEAVHFIQKPFSSKDLLAKVRETLDGV